MTRNGHTAGASDESSSTARAWLVALGSGLIAGVVTSVCSLVATDLTISSERDQAREDYLRTERRKAYADFQVCINDIQDAFFDLFESRPRPHVVDAPYSEHLVTAIHKANECVDSSYIQLELIAPTDVTKTSWAVQNYYGLRVQALDWTQRALSAKPIDPGVVNHARASLNNQEVKINLPKDDTEEITFVRSRLTSQMRNSLGNSSEN